MLRLARLRSVGVDLACQLLPSVFGKSQLSSLRKKARRLRRPAHLLLEPLEDRTLLSATASILGNVSNGSGVNQTNSPGLAGQTVFLDLNHDGQFDNAVTTVNATSLTINSAITGSLQNVGLPAFASALQVQNLLPTAVQDVAVNLDLTNNNSYAVPVYLISPVGFTVPNGPALFTIQPGQTFNGTFDDNANNLIADATGANLSGTFVPDQVFSSPQMFINNGNPIGAWGLTFMLFGNPATDLSKLDLKSWSLSFTQPEPNTHTDASGNYSFTGLTPGSYQVTLALPSGETVTSPVGGAISQSVSVGDGQAQIGVNFGVATLPDLTSVSFTLASPATGFGQKITINYTVTNQGDGNAPAFDADVLLSDNGTISDSEPLLDTLHLGALAAGASTSGSVTVTLPLAPPAPGFASLASDYVGFDIDPKKPGDRERQSQQR